VASLGAHTAVWTACWDEEGAERAASGAAAAGLDFLEIPLGDPVAFDVASTRSLLVPTRPSLFMTGPHLVNTAAGADEMIDCVGEPNVFAHLDTFHMNVEEKGFREPVLRLGERLRYVHLSESDRGTPGTGNVRWDDLFDALAEIRFDGRLVLESFVHPDPDMTSLAALWRDVSRDPEEPLREGLPFLREKAEGRGLTLG